MRLRRLAIAALADLIIAAAIAAPILGALLCERALHVPQTPWQDAPYPNLAVTRAADGIRLRGVFLTPSTASVGCVVVLHGIGDTHLGPESLGRMLLENGYSVLLPDSRAHGWSEGAITTYGVLEARDVSRWVDWLESRDCHREIYGLGESLGGSVLLQSLKWETRFRAVVAECAFSSFPAIARDRLEEAVPIPHWLAGLAAIPVVYSGVAYAYVRYGIKLTSASAVDGVRRTRTPVLLIHGREDTKTPIRHSRVILAANPALVQLWEVPGAGHTGAFGAAPDEFRRRVLGWFQSHR
jgi:alpha-beta hydrolase superfamily lysophospholipase